eukprot:TRINITY_DN10239_c1_g1_i1.p1 TRINITY_DN10239_c1_g1~~TRINITY_DN10239_c1_g1_i1.p1  ORF type:complete len:118 (+),score=10.43 TRINITY_DN10239_c1_g1_i1:103-456(+)
MVYKCLILMPCVLRSLYAVRSGHVTGSDQFQSVLFSRYVVQHVMLHSHADRLISLQSDCMLCNMSCYTVMLIASFHSSQTVCCAACPATLSCWSPHFTPVRLYWKEEKHRHHAVSCD